MRAGRRGAAQARQLKMTPSTLPPHRPPHRVGLVAGVEGRRRGRCAHHGSARGLGCQESCDERAREPEVREGDAHHGRVDVGDERLEHALGGETGQGQEVEKKGGGGHALGGRMGGQAVERRPLPRMLRASATENGRLPLLREATLSEEGALGPSHPSHLVARPQPCHREQHHVLLPPSTSSNRQARGQSTASLPPHSHLHGPPPGDGRREGARLEARDRAGECAYGRRCGRVGRVPADDLRGQVHRHCALLGRADEARADGAAHARHGVGEHHEALVEQEGEGREGAALRRQGRGSWEAEELWVAAGREGGLHSYWWRRAAPVLVEEGG